MKITDTQTIAIISSIPIIITSIIAYRQSTRSKKLDVQIEEHKLQSISQGQLLEQVKFLNQKIDDKEKYWQTRFDNQERHCEERIDLLELEIKKLYDENHFLKEQILELKQRK